MRQKVVDLTQFFHLDTLSGVLMALVAFVALSVGSYSLRYLKGDRRQRAFFVNLTTLILSVSVMVCADHLLVLLVSWGCSNFLLAKLMVHKREWEAARQSSILAGKNFGWGFGFLGCAFLILYTQTGETSVQAILTRSIGPEWVIASGLLLLLAAMTQSALWPFHRWLTSSLNSPTPVSAMMHAGLVNGGGFLLARFAPLLARQSIVLNSIFIVGIATALLGTLWKLMQSDVKRMLASSTMGQMGFMIAQCGLGLFPAAVAHLCCHGLFKAYLFLASGSAAKESRLDLEYPPSLKQFLLSLVCGALAACMFAWTSEKQLMGADTTLFLTFLAMIAGAQFSLPIIRGKRSGRLLLAVAASVLMGSCYGFGVLFIEQAIAPMQLTMPQPLNSLHFVAAALLAGSWLAMLFVRPYRDNLYPDWLLKLYVQMLNASQPHPKTITSHRNTYQF